MTPFLSVGLRNRKITRSRRYSYTPSPHPPISPSPPLLTDLGFLTI
ncbi:MAG: hypothetical protein SW833_14680 [Cyanobacteriota bacterium]|nr:hypothetical protein [Cyanobacteriota bacterium]